METKHVTRCEWIQGKPDFYIEYHDNVWGKPEYDDQELFKWLSLEIFHIGLSWQLVLSKYEGFMEAFNAFNPDIVSNYDEEKIDELMKNENIIRYRQKIEATINNAQRFKEVQEEFGQFSDYIWSFTEGDQIIRNADERQTDSLLSDQVSKDLKKRGFKFIGSVTTYSYLQAIGIVNDHDQVCDFK